MLESRARKNDLTVGKYCLGSGWRPTVEDHNHESLVTESHGILFARREQDENFGSNHVCRTQIFSTGRSSGFQTASRKRISRRQGR